jgi:predicted dinucleotide-binding enzyme
MEIGMIGAGPVAQAFAGHLIKAGHTVILSNSRGPETLSSLVAALGPQAKAGTPRQAVRARMVLLAVPWTNVADVLSTLPAWNGQILIDATNQFISPPPNAVLADLGNKASSEVVAELAPGARVVKAFNSLYATNLAADPRQGPGRRVVFVSGNDKPAKNELAAILKDIGFATIDLGSLHDGGRMQQAGGPLAGLNLLRLA